MPSYKSFMTDLAQKAGRTMLKHFSFRVKNSYKLDHSPVTKADLDINHLVIESVKRRFPTHDVLGEEESHLSNSSEYVWVCDPIDGTIPYSRGIPVSVFSLALTHHGKPVVGIIYDPFHRKTFFAETGKGATLNGKRIRVSPKKELEHALIGMDWWRLAKYNLSSIYTALHKKDAHLLNLGSITHMAALVATGQFEATLLPHHAAHDTAAVKLIVEEAGGKVTDLFGKEQRYDQDIRGHIVSNGLLHSKLVKLVRTHIKK